MKEERKISNGTTIKTAFLAAVFSITAVFLPVAVFADHSDMHTIQQLKTQVASLQQAVASLLGSTNLVLALSDEERLEAAKQELQSFEEQAKKREAQNVKDRETELLKEEIESSKSKIKELEIRLGKTSGLNLARTLQKGSTGDDVKDLQEFLAKDKDVYPEGLATGYFGSLTENAVKNFQNKNGIEPVGIVGPKTRAVLNEGAKEVAASGLPTSSKALVSRTIERGALGSDVKDAQELLNKFPDIYPQGQATGFFGPATETAVKKLQEKLGLPATGNIDEPTRKKINDIAAAVERKQPPKISAIAPAEISVSTKVTLTGTGFTLENNSLFIKGKTVLTGLTSYDGTEIVFAIPADIPCEIGPACPIKITNSNGISNAKPIKLVEAVVPPTPEPIPEPIPTPTPAPAPTSPSSTTIIPIPCDTSTPRPAGYITYDICSDQEPAVVRRSNGDIVSIFNSGGNNLAVLRGAVSHDQGATWTVSTFAAQSWDDEALVEGPDGGLVLFALAPGGETGLVTYTSIDGITWGNKRKLSPAEANNSVGDIIYASDGYYYASYHGFASAATPFADTLITRSRDLVTWELPIKATNGLETSNDSSLLQTADGMFWLAYYVFPSSVNSGGVVIMNSADTKTWVRQAFISGLGPNHGAVNLIEYSGKPVVLGRMGYGTYYSYRLDTGAWSQPQNILDNTPFGGEAVRLADGTIGLVYVHIANFATDPYGQRDIRFANVGALPITAPVPAPVPAPTPPPAPSPCVPVTLSVPEKYSTIRGAIDAATCPGTIIQIAAGTYYEILVLKSDITLVGAGPGMTIIDGSKTEPTVSPWGYLVQNFNVITAGKLGSGVKNVQVKNLSITGSGAYGDNAAIRIQDSSNVLVENVLFYRNTDGLRIYGSSPVTVKNVTLVGNRNGVMSHGTTKVMVKNSIIAQNSAWGLYATIGVQLTSAYNAVWGNGTNYDGVVSGVGDISLDPRLGGAPQYLVLGGSPTIDTGDPADAYSLEPLPNGGRINMGSYGNTQWATTSSTSVSPPPPPSPPPAVPAITGISPSYGNTGIMVKLIGSGFTATGNEIHFVDVYTDPHAIIQNLASSDGLTLTFTVPSNLPCSELENCTVFVKNANGVSKSVSFFRTLTVVPAQVISPNGGATIVQGQNTTLHY